MTARRWGAQGGDRELATQVAIWGVPVELIGQPALLDLPWGLEIDPEHRPARYADDATFHPNFLYEIVWNLSLAWFAHTQRAAPQGERPARTGHFFHPDSRRIDR